MQGYPESLEEVTELELGEDFPPRLGLGPMALSRPLELESLKTKSILKKIFENKNDC